MAIEDPYWLDRDRAQELRDYVEFLANLANSLQHVVVPAMGDRFDGTAESIHAAMCDPLSAVFVTHEDRIPIGTIRQAIQVHRKHTPTLLDDYIARAKVPTRKGYVALMRRQQPLPTI